METKTVQLTLLLLSGYWLCCCLWLWPVVKASVDLRLWAFGKLRGGLGYRVVRGDEWPLREVSRGPARVSGILMRPVNS